MEAPACVRPRPHLRLTYQCRMTLAAVPCSDHQKNVPVRRKRSLWSCGACTGRSNDGSKYSSGAVGVKFARTPSRMYRLQARTQTETARRQHGHAVITASDTL